MRVSLCKIQWSHCPSRYICFCTKPSSPSSTHLHKPQSPTTSPSSHLAPITALIKVDHESTCGNSTTTMEKNKRLRERRTVKWFVYFCIQNWKNMDEHLVRVK
ncbi:hypothetical protein Droror1_Dr00009507 [Drosera rotundifolia]